MKYLLAVIVFIGLKIYEIVIFPFKLVYKNWKSLMPFVIVFGVVLMAGILNMHYPKHMRLFGLICTISVSVLFLSIIFCVCWDPFKDWIIDNWKRSKSIVGIK